MEKQKNEQDKKYIELVLAKIDELPIFNPFLKNITVFRKLIERDRGSKGDADGRKKRQSVKELCFIHLYTHWLDNPFFRKYKDLKEREKALVLALELPDNWKMDEDIIAATEWYTENIVITDEMELILAGQQAARETTKYFRGVDYERRDTKGNLLYKPKEVMQSIKEIEGLIDKLQSSREKIEKQERIGSTKIRGGGAAGNRERPRNVS